MYVEFLGLPASGKSTILGNCKEFLKLNGLTFAARPFLDLEDKKSGKIPPNIRRNPAMSAIYRSEQFRHKFPEFMKISDELFGNDLAANTFFITNAAYYMSYAELRKPNTIHCVDEGFTHRGIYAFNRYHGNNDELFDAFFQNLPPIDLIIHTKIDPKIGYERVTSRLQTRLGPEIQPRAIANRITNAHGNLLEFTRRGRTMELACDILKKRGVNVIEVDVTTSLEQSVRTALRGIYQLYF